MKYFQASLCAAFLSFLGACANNSTHIQPTPDPAATPGAAAPAYFPVADWLKSEILYVDSTPLAILKYDIIGSKKDSAYIHPEEFNRLALGFMLPQLTSDSLQKNYTETMIADKTTGYLTFSYMPRDPSAELHRVDVVTKQAQTANRVKSIYLERLSGSGDSLIVYKMFWTAGHNFVVLSDPRNGKGTGRQLKVVWNEEDTE